MFASLFSLTVGLLSIERVAASVVPQHAISSQAESVAQDGSRGVAIASESQLCSDIGAKFFREHSNATAADAIVATVLCTGTVAMYHSGLGGGGFALVRSEDSYEWVDFRPNAPQGTREDLYTHLWELKVGGKAMGVPGELQGLWHIHGKYGKVPWEKVFQPAIDLAANGFKVNAYMEDALAMRLGTKIGSNFLCSPPWDETFCPNGSDLVQCGDMIRRLSFSRTLEKIARNGTEIFYHGEIADSIEETVKAQGGILQKVDLEDYTIRTGTTTPISYNSFHITSTTAPSSGSVTLSTLKILERYGADFAPGDDALSTHRFIEAIRFSYAQRSRLGDPRFSHTINMTDYEQWMLEHFPEKVSIDDERTFHDPEHYMVDWQAKIVGNNIVGDASSGGTTHISAVDQDGLAISLTTSIGSYFGSRVMDGKTGIIMDNVMADFYHPNLTVDSLVFEQNRMQGGKRALSGMSPTIITRGKDKELYFITGSAGGSKIPTATLQSIINVLNRNMSAKAALDQPRLHDQLRPDQTTFENSTDGIRVYNELIVDRMAQAGHNVKWVGLNETSVQAIRLVDGKVEAKGEPWQHNSGGAVWPPEWEH